MTQSRAVPGEITDAARICHTFARGLRVSDIACIEFDDAWNSNGVSIGLVDGSVDAECPDLVGAHIVSRDFVGASDLSPESIVHGTSMAKLLVGQGRQYLRGVAPHAKLFGARAVGPCDLATPDRVAAAIDWLLSENIRIIALPLGSETAAPVVDGAIARGIAAGARIFAASGCGAGAILYPARHSSVIAVGPADDEGRPLPEARREPRLDLLAPGWQVAGVTADGGVCNGSSIACVLAAGAAALRTYEKGAA